MEWFQVLGTAWKVLFDILYFGSIIGTILIIVLDNRSPVHTIAWVLILLFLPVVGLILYFFFGRNVRREHIINKKSYSKLLSLPVSEFMAQKPLLNISEYDRLINFYYKTEQAYPLEGNQIQVFVEGYSMLQSLIKELMNARHHIHLEYYVFEDDPVGRLIRDVLIDRAKAGIEVRLIYDDVGCWKVKNRFFEEMQQAGIEVRGFLKVHFPLLTSRVNYRNHRKIVIIDGRIGYIGGMNIAVRYLKGIMGGIWRDTHILIEGKAVHALQASFLLDWYFVDRKLITEPQYFGKVNIHGSSMMQIVSSSPIGPWKEIMLGLTKAILCAKRYFYIQTPYFLPTETILSALQTAALAGVDVRLMLPEKNDSWLSQLACSSYLKYVLEAGVKVFLYSKGFLHSKLMVSDDMFSTIGSTNVDFRSFEHNFEINAFIYDKDMALKMREIFLNDQRSSKQVVLSLWVQRPWYKKVAGSITRLLAPLL
jgi:cardiolipin synthase